MRQKIVRRTAVRAVAAAVAAALAVTWGTNATAGPSRSTDAGMAAMSAAGAGHWDQVGGAAFHSDGTTRTYYVGADQVVWDYAPGGRNMISGTPFDRVADTYVRRGQGRI